VAARLFRARAVPADSRPTLKTGLSVRGFRESFQVAEVATHRVFVLLIVVFAVFEWRVQTSNAGARRSILVFPLVCAVGGHSC